MSLLRSLAGAKLVVVDEEQELAYVWFGGAGVNVYDEGGREVHYFTMSAGFDRKLTEKMVRASIDRVRAQDAI